MKGLAKSPPFVQSAEISPGQAAAEQAVVYEPALAGAWKTIGFRGSAACEGLTLPDPPYASAALLICCQTQSQTLKSPHGLDVVLTWAKPVSSKQTLNKDVKVLT